MTRPLTSARVGRRIGSGHRLASPQWVVRCVVAHLCPVARPQAALLRGSNSAAAATRAVPGVQSETSARQGRAAHEALHTPAPPVPPLVLGGNVGALGHRVRQRHRKRKRQQCCGSARDRGCRDAGQAERGACKSAQAERRVGARLPGRTGIRRGALRATVSGLRGGAAQAAAKKRSFVRPVRLAALLLPGPRAPGCSETRARAACAAPGAGMSSEGHCGDPPRLRSGRPTRRFCIAPATSKRPAPARSKTCALGLGVCPCVCFARLCGRRGAFAWTT